MIEATDDAVLIRDCLRGDPEAFSAIVRKYQDRLFNVVFRLVQNREDAQDIVQESFLRCFRSLESFQGQSAFYTWLYRIAVNAAVSLKRRTAGSPLSPDRCVAVDREPEDTDPRIDPASPLECQDTRRQVLEALDSLPDEYRSVLVLKEIDGLKYEAIARILNCPVGTVRSRLHRARMEMRQRLRHVMEQA